MKRKQKRILLRIIASAILLCFALVLSKAVKINETVVNALYLAAYITIGYDVIIKAALSLRHRRLLDENFLMSVASVGAVALGEFTESVSVMLFYQIGEFFQSYAVGKSRKSIAKLMNIRPDTARVIRENGTLLVLPDEVIVGDIIEVLKGEKIALDGVCVSGNSMLDTSALTGESLPREVITGNEVFAGCINMGDVIKIRVTKPFEDSSVVKILNLIENATANKAKSEKFITKFSRWYTPTVTVLALLLAVIPQFFTDNPLEWLKRALIFLVISCPCALVISVPLSFFGGIGAASKRGVLVKGTGYLETLSECDTIVFDKTGTLTKGSFSVFSVNSDKIPKEALLAICASIENYSNHPIARSIVTAAGEDYKKYLVDDIKEISGMGISGKINGHRIFIGNSFMMNKLGIYCENSDALTVHIAFGKEYAGNIVLADEIKEETKEAIESLKEIGIKETYMLTGDIEKIAQNIAEQIGIDKVYSGLLPQDKVDIFKSVKANGKKVAFVGDGINDAPVIALSDVGIAMGSMGSDAAIEAADIVLMDDNPLKICEAVKIAKRTKKIATQNIIFALAVKAAFLIMGACGISGMFGAVIADVGVSFVAILNAMRTLK
ncbi:MAG: cadmium-translocating P-type ATPase [Ruminococcaceae bacterium]|nr:cadmium-translocating P-type ATPase [Oscillospiraceae bacterium]